MFAAGTEQHLHAHFSTDACSIRYSAASLKSIRDKSSKVLLAVDTFQLINDIGIRRPFRGTRGGRKGLPCHQRRRGVCLNNLRVLPRAETGYIHDSNISVATINLKSIRNKADEFLHHVITNDYDICTVTETWLTQCDDKCRSDLNQCGYRFIDAPRFDRRGGGTGIIYKEQYTMKKLKAGSKQSFEFSEWQFCDPPLHTVFVVIYRPPYSATHPVSLNIFIQEFSDYASDVLSENGSVVFSGDFNIHVNSESDLNSQRFLSAIHAMGLKQHVFCSTHRSGNTLDLFITRENDSLCLSNPHSGYFISYHCFVETTFSRPKLKQPKSFPTKKINIF